MMEPTTRDMLQRQIECEAPRFEIRLHEGVVDAGRRAVAGPSSLVRGLICTAVAEDLGAPVAISMRVASAIELMHAASLIFDDLPYMDDALTRRGRLALHREVGAAGALLTALALLNRTFQIVVELDIDTELRVALVAELSGALHPDGALAGQRDDLGLGAAAADLPSILARHRLKTGSVFRAALRCGAILGGAEPNGDAVLALGKVGEAFGELYQIRDDAEDAGADATAGANVWTSAVKEDLATVISRRQAELRRAIAPERFLPGRARLADAINELEQRLPVESAILP